MIEEVTEELLALKAESAINQGMDFLVRTQCTDRLKADFGRFPHEYDISKCKTQSYSVNWTTALAVDTFLIAYRFFQSSACFEAAKRGIDYIKTLQVFSPFNDNYGMILEETPQSCICHPRDALTAALSLLNWSQETGDIETLKRARFFADWFIRVAMRENYPYWTVELNGRGIDPDWLGSFHSGSAFFFCRMYSVTKDERYLDAAKIILDHYNKFHLDESGFITVIRDRKKLIELGGDKVSHHAPSHWQLMHVYNDDFGALANLAAYNILGDSTYLKSAENFLMCMVKQQKSNGAFGNDQEHVPSASGVIVVELLAAKELGLNWCAKNTIDSAIKFILDLQFLNKSSEANGAFRESPELNDIINLRTISYSLMALLRYVGAKDSFYFFNQD